MRILKKLKQSFLKEITGKSNWFWTVILITAIVDYLNTLYFERTQMYFYNIFEGKDSNAMLYLIGIFVILIIVIILTGLMSSYKTARSISWKNLKRQKFITGVFAIMVIGFSIILLMPSINILGMGGEGSNFSDNHQYTYFMILLAFVFAVIILAFIPFKAKLFLGNFNYLLVYIPIIIFVLIAIDFSSAIWKFLFLNSSEIVDPNRPSRIVEFIVLFPFYAMFFAAPRFILLRKSVSIFTWLSTIASTMFFVWKSLEFMEL